MSTRILLSGLSLAALSACSVPAQQSTSETTTATPAAIAAQPPDLSARGEYLVRVTGCNDCHTPAYGDRGGKVPTSEWLVGSPLGFNGPWGTTYAANLRLKAAEMDEAAWLEYTGNLHTRPIMPDYNIRDMTEEDRRALYHFIRSLGPAGSKAPDFLPPGQTPPPPYMQLVLPPPPKAA